MKKRQKFDIKSFLYVENRIYKEAPHDVVSKEEIINMQYDLRYTINIQNQLWFHNQ